MVIPGAAPDHVRGRAISCLTVNSTQPQPRRYHGNQFITEKNTCDDVNANKSLLGNEHETPSIRSSRSHGRPAPVISGNASAAGGASVPGSARASALGPRTIGVAGPVIPPIGLTGAAIPNPGEAKREGTGPLGRVGSKMGKKQQGRRGPGLVTETGPRNGPDGPGGAGAGAVRGTWRGILAGLEVTLRKFTCVPTRVPGTEHTWHTSHRVRMTQARGRPPVPGAIR